MRGKMKAAISMALAAAMVMSLSTVAFADSESTVSVTQDNITVTKSAEWTTVDGKVQDENGNPYAKINFKVDTTKATTEVTKAEIKGGATDVMLVLDTSGSMDSKSKIDPAKTAACAFADEVMSITTNDVNVGLVTFATSSKIVAPLTKDKEAVKNAINGMKASGGTDMAGGIENAITAFSASKAPNKIMVVLGDGYPDSSSKTKTSATKAKDAGIKVVTIGYECNENLLKEIASDGASGKMYYKAAATATGVVKDLGTTFVNIENQVKVAVNGKALVDQIPTEFDVVEGTLMSNDAKLVASLSDDKKTVTWSWGTNNLEKKVYEMSVVVKLDMSKVPADYISNNSSIFTNGTTIKTDVDSTGSAVLTYGETGVINLKSPKLSLADRTKEAAKEDNKLTGEGIKEDKVDNSPKTGDSFNTVAIVLLAGAAVVLVGSGVALKKRNSR